MITANIGTTKNELSRLLRHVKRGGRVIITERNRPVAQIQPIAEPEPGARDSRLAALQHSGVLLPPAGKPLDVEVFLSAPRPTLSRTKGLVAAVLAEREEGR